MNVYYGVVESRADPLKIGRCKVRVIGIHTENTSILPTKDLPWAIPLMPITSASTSGIGYSPTGIVEGSWVCVFFRDGESFQEPIILGSFFGIPQSQPKVEVTNEVSQYAGFLASTNNTQTKNKADNNIKSQSFEKVGLNEMVEASDKQTVTSTQYASSNNASNILKQVQQTSFDKSTNNNKVFNLGNFTSSTLATNIGSHRALENGSYTYGKFDLNSGIVSNDSVPSNSSLMQFIKTSQFKDDFDGLFPGTEEFNKQWETISSQHTEQFEKEQLDFALSTLYNPLAFQLKNKGIDLLQRGAGIQEMVFSTALTYGRDNTIIEEALSGKNVYSLTDNEILNIVSAYKEQNATIHFPNKTKDEIEAYKKTLADERIAHTFLSNETIESKEDVLIAQKKASGIDKPLSTLTEEDIKTIKETKLSPSTLSTPRTIETNDGAGFKDPFNVYPKREWIGEAETSRLSRNERIEKTIIQSKKNSLLKGVGGAHKGSWDEPQSPFNPKYPLNHVFQSESGHVREYDDTPNYERVHIYHRSGSFIEFHPNGDIVFKSVKDKFDICVSNKNVYVGGDCNVTIKGDCNIYSKGNMNLMSEENINIRARGNVNINAGGRGELISSGTLNVGSVANTNIGSQGNVMLNCTWKPTNPDFDFAHAGNISISNVERIEDRDLSLDENNTNTNGFFIRKEDTPTNPATNPDFDKNVEPPREAEKQEEQEKEQCPGADNITSNTQLSEHYKLADVTTSCAVSSCALTSQCGLSKCEIFENLSAITKNVAENVRRFYGDSFIITSGLRKGSGRSQHYKGQALDFQFYNARDKRDVLRLAKIADEIVSFLPTFDQMILEDFTGNKGLVLHISYNTKGNRRQKLFGYGKNGVSGITKPTYYEFYLTH